LPRAALLDDGALQLFEAAGLGRVVDRQRVVARSGVDAVAARVEIAAASDRQQRRQAQEAGVKRRWMPSGAGRRFRTRPEEGA
jgi:hypothetical protein